MSVPRRRVWGERAWMTVGPEGLVVLVEVDVEEVEVDDDDDDDDGTPTFPVTCPVSLSAALTTPSVPAE